MSGYKQRTDAERDAIDERARNWQRPPSPTQREALQLLAQEPFVYTAAGWHPASNHGLDEVQHRHHDRARRPRARQVQAPRHPQGVDHDHAGGTRGAAEGATKVKNKLADLNDHLFAQMERLSDESLTPEQLDKESKRSDAIVAVADQIVRNAALQVQAAKLVAERGAIRPLLPPAMGTLEPPRPKLIEGTSK